MVTKWSRQALPSTTRLQLFHVPSTGGEGRRAAARPREDRHHERHLRSRVAIDAEGRGGEAQFLVEVTNHRNRRSIRRVRRFDLSVSLDPLLLAAPGPR